MALVRVPHASEESDAEQAKAAKRAARLYQIAGDPECDDHLQPGVTGLMTWVYRVPLDAAIVASEFEDLSDFTRARR